MKISKGVNNNNYNNNGRDLLLDNKPWVVPWGAERMPQRIQIRSRVTLDRSTAPKWEQNQTEKFSSDLDWLRKSIWYGQQSWIINCLKMYKISHEVKLYRENHENLESGINSRRKKLCWSKGLKKYISRRCTVIVAIQNCDDST